MDSWKITANYHQQTKHHFHRYARSPGYMDWASQPDPFRRFVGAPLVRLPLSADRQTIRYDDLYEPQGRQAQAVTLQTLGSFFQLALAVSAWKEHQHRRWALRVNPSSGNLHPTESYVIAPAIEDLHAEPGAYHYAPQEHGLELRTTLASQRWEQMCGNFPAGTFFVGLSSIYWREAWKYGERAYRYCQHDVGHALAALRVSAAVHGWSLQLLEALSDAEIAALLGLDRSADFQAAERESPELLAAVMPPGAGRLEKASIPSGVIQHVAAGSWHGQGNRLSTRHVPWEIIEAVSAACAKPATEWYHRTAGIAVSPVDLQTNRSIAARHMILQRRSAVALDEVTCLTRDQFYLMLARVMPCAGRMPWDISGAEVCVHLALFVHRVDGLTPGLYFLLRDPGQQAALQRAMDGSFAWHRPAGCPDGLPLSLLQAGDCRSLAGQLSCGQAIAADGAFSLGMVARFEEPLRRHGAWFYRRLFWETGVIGQILYLEAEAAGVRGTGIGCFFDDPVHDVLGLQDLQYQSLYHFTVGGPVEDTRLTTLPPYEAERTA